MTGPFCPYTLDSHKEKKKNKQPPKNKPMMGKNEEDPQEEQ